MTRKFIIERTFNDYEKNFLRLHHGEFDWIDCSDYDSWDEAKRRATLLTEIEAIIIRTMLRGAPDAFRYEFLIEEVRA